MYRSLIAGAYRLDLWLDRHMGRPYTVLLVVGLTAEIGRRIAEFHPGRLELGHILDFAWLLALNLALLVHTLASLHHIRERRRAAKGSALAPHD
jgi:hypothetical protein